jgi:hypothetical protein
MRRAEERCRSGESARFGSWQDAAREARRLHQEDGSRWRPYDRACPWCQQWYLTSSRTHRARPRNRRKN